MLKAVPTDPHRLKHETPLDLRQMAQQGRSYSYPQPADLVLCGLASSIASTCAVLLFRAHDSAYRDPSAAADAHGLQQAVGCTVETMWMSTFEQMNRGQALLSHLLDAPEGLLPCCC